MRAPHWLRMAYDEPEIEEGYDDDEEDDEEEGDDDEEESEETWQVGSGELAGSLDFWWVKIEDCAVFGRKAG